MGPSDILTEVRENLPALYSLTTRHLTAFQVTLVCIDQRLHCEPFLENVMLICTTEHHLLICTAHRLAGKLSVIGIIFLHTIMKIGKL